MTDILRNILSIFQLGGPVLWVLLAVSVVAFTLVIERATFWWGLHKPGRGAWVAKALSLLKKGDIGGTKTLAAADTTLYAGIVDELVTVRLTDSTAVGLVEERRHLVERFNGALSTIITAAPLIGLLGTVTGIIRSFDVIGDASAVRDIPAVAQGVSEALLNTAAGLAVALLTLLPTVIFKAQTDRFLSNAEALAAAAAQGRGGSPTSRTEPSAQAEGQGARR
ncbi:MAG: MotA/TolQ/ExbB proton channel family protein [Phycisphaerales bacterium]